MSNLAFPIHVATSSWVFGDDEVEERRPLIPGGVTLLFLLCVSSYFSSEDQNFSNITSYLRIFLMFL